MVRSMELELMKAQKKNTKMPMKETKRAYGTCCFVGEIPVVAAAQSISLLSPSIADKLVTPTIYGKRS